MTSAPDEPQIAVDIDRATIAGVDPEVAPIDEVVLRAVEIAVRHHMWEARSHPELPLGARVHRHAVIVDDDRVVPTGEPSRRSESLRLMGRLDGDESARFGLPV